MNVLIKPCCHSERSEGSGYINGLDFSASIQMSVSQSLDLLLT